MFNNEHDLHRLQAQVNQEVHFSTGQIKLVLGSIVGLFVLVVMLLQINWQNSEAGRNVRATTDCIGQLRDTLNDPWSLEVYSSSPNKIEYSAKNAFGGRVRDTYYCK